MRNIPLFLIGAGAFLASVDHAHCYELGQGLQAGDFYLSGYGSIVAVDGFSAPSYLKSGDLSLFAGGHVNRYFNPFTEVEFSDQTLVKQGGSSINGSLIVERFYNDALLSSHDTLRIGKILTPIGDWNLIHAAPLTPLITRPASTALGFDAYTSGIDWLHDPETGKEFDFQIYGEPTDEIFKRPASISPRNFRNTYGAHINMPLNMMDKIGVSFQHSQLIETGETFTLYGINANKSFGHLALQSEAVSAHFTGTQAARMHSEESGIYALADYTFIPQWHAILEGEHYQDHLNSQPSRSAAAGLDYRPSSSMVWKLEYTHQAGTPTTFAPAYTGVKASFSTMF